MKKILILSVCLLTIFTLSAQTTLMIKGGAGIATQSGIPPNHILETTYDPIGVGHFGIATHFKLGNQFALQVEALYQEKGVLFNHGDFLLSTPIDPVIVDLTFKYTHLDLPILGVYTPVELEQFAVDVFGGIYGSYILNATETTEFSERSILFGDGSNRFKVGFTTGFAFKYQLGIGQIIFDCRYNQSFSNVVESDDIMIRNHLVTGSLGYAIDL